MSLNEQLLGKDQSNSTDTGLPYAFQISQENLSAGLQMSEASRAMEGLRGQSGLYSIYSSSAFVLRTEGLSQQESHDYQAGFALMVQGIHTGLVARGMALPHIRDEVEVVAEYEHLSRIWRSVFVQDRLKTALVYNELDLLMAVDAAAPNALDQRSGRMRDLASFWDGAVDAYMVLSHATANQDSAYQNAI